MKKNDGYLVACDFVVVDESLFYFPSVDVPVPCDYVHRMKLADYSLLRPHHLYHQSSVVDTEHTMVGAHVGHAAVHVGHTSNDNNQHDDSVLFEKHSLLASMVPSSSLDDVRLHYSMVDALDRWYREVPATNCSMVVLTLEGIGRGCHNQEDN